jgi:hypothetical protein
MQHGTQPAYNPVKHAWSAKTFVPNCTTVALNAVLQAAVHAPPDATGRTQLCQAVALPTRRGGVVQFKPAGPAHTKRNRSSHAALHATDKISVMTKSPSTGGVRYLFLPGSVPSCDKHYQPHYHGVFCLPRPAENDIAELTALPKVGPHSRAVDTGCL